MASNLPIFFRESIHHSVCIFPLLVFLFISRSRKLTECEHNNSCWSNRWSGSRRVCRTNCSLASSAVPLWQFFCDFCTAKQKKCPYPSMAFSAQHLSLRPSGVFSCWPDGLELTPGFYPGSNEQHRLFSAATQNVLVRALLVHPAR